LYAAVNEYVGLVDWFDYNLSMHPVELGIPLDTPLALLLRTQWNQLIAKRFSLRFLENPAITMPDSSLSNSENLGTGTSLQTLGKADCSND
jgi:hypothetical protein